MWLLSKRAGGGGLPVPRESKQCAADGWRVGAGSREGRIKQGTHTHIHLFSVSGLGSWAFKRISVVGTEPRALRT